MKTNSLFYIMLLNLLLLTGATSKANCVGGEPTGPIEVKILKSFKAYHRNQQIEGCLIEALDTKSGMKTTGYTRYDFICDAQKSDMIKVNINQLCCDSGDFPEPCGVTSGGILGFNKIKANGTVFVPMKIDERSFSQIKTALGSKDFFLRVRALQDVEKIRERKQFRSHLEELLKAEDYRIKGEAAYLLLTSQDLTLSPTEKWKFAIFALNSFSEVHAKEALESITNIGITQELLISTIDSVMTDLHHGNRADLLLEVLRSMDETIITTLFSKRLDPGSASVIPRNALEDIIKLGPKAKGLESNLITYMRYPYFGNRLRDKAAEALCSINAFEARKHSFDSGKVVIRCSPTLIEHVECLNSACQK